MKTYFDKSFFDLKKNLKKETKGFKKIKLAVLGDSATQFLVQSIKGLGVDFEIEFDIWEADFNQIERQILDPSSELYQFNPEIVIIFQSSHKLLGKYNKSDSSEYTLFANQQIADIREMYSTVQENLSAKVIYYNYSEIDDSVFGNFANKTEVSFLYQLRKLNFQLMDLSNELADFFICDLSTIQNQVGKANFFQPSIYVSTEMTLSIEVLPKVAGRTLDLIRSLKGQFVKCIVLDLDNTTWGGIIGDDGIEHIQVGSLGIGKAFSEFQYWVKKLKNRGVIVAVCSKNTESVALEPFEKHPDMVLKLEDISVFKANWDNKADNIREIQGILNIGFDSMVFVDDNPFERNIVRENIPEVIVPELPEDPAEYLEFLYTLNLFETTSFSNADKDRTKQYQIEAKRSKVKKSFTDENDFLSSLEMTSIVEPFNSFNTPRIAQLSQRSNQFNLRTIRYTEKNISELEVSSNHLTFSFTLKDRFGENGLICVVILEQKDKQSIFIDTWFMSCRVLKRGMENFVLNTIVEESKKNGFQTIIGEYLPTPKNAMVEDHYKNLGFSLVDNQWILDVNEYKNRVTHITKS